MLDRTAAFVAATGPFALAVVITALAVSSGARAACDAPDEQIHTEATAAAVSRVREIVATTQAEHGIPGMAVAVQDRDRGLLYSGAFGESQVEVDACLERGSILPLGSVSKLVTAAIAARLAARGELDVDADVRELVPAAAGFAQPVTVRQLLGHLGGVRHYEAGDFDFAQPGGIIDLRLYPDTASALAIFVDDPPVAAPGERYHYSTFGYTLAAAALEAVSGRAFLAQVTQEVAEPLSLASLQGDELRTVIPRRAGRYEKENGDLVRAWPANVAYKWAGGGLVATAEDLARFGVAHAGPGYLDADVLAAMMTSQRTVADEVTDVGWAWRLGKDPAGRVVHHHAGAIGGGRAVLVVWPAEGLAVAMQTNLSGTPGNILELAQAAGGAFLGAD